MLTAFEIIILILTGISAIILLIFIAIGFTGEITGDADTTISKPKSKIKQFLFIEDGSVDQTSIEDLNERNPEIKVIVYRQGSRMPVIENLKIKSINKEE